MSFMIMEPPLLASSSSPLPRRQPQAEEKDKVGPGRHRDEDDDDETRGGSPENNTLFVNDDWEATCSIYPDWPTEIKFINNHSPQLLQSSSQQQSTYRSSSSSVECSLDVPISTARMTFLRKLGRDDSSSTYRVWTLPPEQATLIWRLTFVYPFQNKNDKNDDDDDDDDDDETNERTTPSAVRVALLDMPERYPHSFPTHRAAAWQDWVQTQATQCLETDVMSYAVVTWLEHYVMEYFGSNVDSNNNDNNGGMLYQRDGFSLVLFDDQGPTHYDIPTLVLTFPGPRSIVKHYVNGRTECLSLAQAGLASSSSMQEYQISPLVLERDAWHPHTCPICLDPFLLHDMERITPCHHAVCADCLRQYLRIKVQDIYTHRDNPFRCPLVTCRQGLHIVGCVKKYLATAHMDRVRLWYKDLKHPLYHALPDCLACQRPGTMRKEAIDSSIIYCDACSKRWCEWCLKRLVVPQDYPKTPITHADADCDATACIQFCQRYSQAGPQARAQCEAKYPWIRTYAQARLDRDSAAAWLKENDGQSCPVCKAGVERIAGCFHIHCVCGAHFCYECGDELFYPFYGTHHCWEMKKTTTTGTGGLNPL